MAAPGPDGINLRILKELAKEVSLPLAIIFNKLLQTGVVPEDWKCANVVPIFKKGSKVDPANYRPISLTSSRVKLLETRSLDQVASRRDLKI